MVLGTPWEVLALGATMAVGTTLWAVGSNYKRDPATEIEL